MIFFKVSSYLFILHDRGKELLAVAMNVVAASEKVKASCKPALATPTIKLM